MGKGVSMTSIPLLTGSRASVFWGADLRRQNLDYLKSLDPGYFQFIADLCADQLDDPTKLMSPDRQRAAMMLRVVHGQGVEALMALIGALAQSPQFPLGWMLRYTSSDLEDVIRAIDDQTASQPAQSQAGNLGFNFSARSQGLTGRRQKKVDDRQVREVLGWSG